MNLKQFFVASWRNALGVLLIVGGIFGLFLPFLQGIAMILGGLVLLRNKTAVGWFARIREKLRTWRKS